jgi:hypothetical protein
MGFEEDSENQITEIIYILVDIDSYYENILYLYIIPRLANYNIILGKPWIKKTIIIKSTRIIINNKNSIRSNTNLRC